MSERSLSNYLRTHRKRAGLSQDEVAFLLGGECGTRVTRHEGMQRTPSLHAALGYALLFGVPLSDLFAGEYEKVEACIRERLPELLVRLEKESPSRAPSRRVRFFSSLRERLAENDA